MASTPQSRPGQHALERANPDRPNVQRGKRVKLKDRHRRKRKRRKR